jgi:hypothetical protein
MSVVFIHKLERSCDEEVKECLTTHLDNSYRIFPNKRHEFEKKIHSNDDSSWESHTLNEQQHIQCVQFMRFHNQKLCKDINNKARNDCPLTSDYVRNCGDDESSR